MEPNPFQTIRTRLAGLALSLVLVSGIVFGPLAASFAHASLIPGVPQPTIELPGPLLTATAAIAGTNAANAATNAIHTTFDTVLAGIGWTVAKVAIQSLTRSIVNWINSGFQGSPAFVTDLNHNLLQLGDAVASNFLQQLASNQSIDSPFRTLIVQAVSAAYYGGTGQNAFFNSNPYTLNRYTSNDTAFINGDFTQGGLNAFFGAFMFPQNNPYGSYLLSQNALNNEIATAQDARTAELNWGRGFLSWRGSCAVTKSAMATPKPLAERASPAPLSIKKLDAKAPLVSASIRLAQNVKTTVTPVSTQTVTPLQTTTGLNNSIPTGTIGGTIQQSANTAGNTVVPLAQTDNCVSYNIETPGSVIESQLENAFGSPIRQLELADSINEIVAALATQLVSQVIGGGGGGVSGLSQPRQGGGASYTNTSTDTAGATTLSAGFVQSIDNQTTQVTQYQNAWQTINTVATNAKNTCADQASTDKAQLVIDSASTALTNASSSLAALQTIKTEAQDTTNPSASLSLAASDYQALLATSAYPSPEAITYAVQQSQETTDATTTPTLYSQMVQLSQSCPVSQVVQ